jgi:hypothetical protein
MTKPGLKRTQIGLLSALLLVACENPGNPIDSAATRFVAAGYLANPIISEASGLARSSHDDQFWVINDGGSLPQLHAIGLDGSDYGSVLLENARNIDWEDLATFEDSEKFWLVVADIGDNSARRNEYTLYIVAEPGAEQLRSGTTSVQRSISFMYPDGPRDAEAITFDAANQQFLILTKRDIPAVLYSVPLHAPSDELLLASRIGEIDSIPQPTAHDLERALPDKNWHWQPNAIDFSAAGDAAAILTYKAVYYFSRQEGQEWFAALQSAPQRFTLGAYREAESVVFDHAGEHIYVTTEKRNAPLLRLPLREIQVQVDE